MKQELTKLASIHWIGIKFSEESLQSNIENDITFCEAITKSITKSPIIINENNFTSNDIKYLFGWNKQLSINKARLLEKYKIEESVIEEVLHDINPLKKKIKSIIINGPEADIFIGLIQPEKMSSIFKRWYFKTGKLPQYKLSPIGNDCAAIAVECYNQDYPVFSFGCDESRKEGNIGRDRLIIAVPNSTI